MFSETSISTTVEIVITAMGGSLSQSGRTDGISTSGFDNTIDITSTAVDTVVTNGTSQTLNMSMISSLGIIFDDGLKGCVATVIADAFGLIAYLVFLRST